MGALLGLHRPPPRTAQEQAEPPTDTISAFLRRYAGALAQAYPGTTLATMRELSLRDIAHLLYWRAEHAKTDDDLDDDDEFGEVR